MSARTAPSRLADFEGRHAGTRMLVLGCGGSLRLLPRTFAGLSVGVNDVGRHVTPTYLCVLNPRTQFPAERFRAVTESGAQAIFTHLDLGRTRAPQVRFRLGARGGGDWRMPDRLPYSRTSAFVALALALRLGATEIGLLGVDFTDDHFFGPTGPHPLARRLLEIDAEIAVLARAAEAEGRSIVNLGPESRLTALPRAQLDAFLAGCPAQTTEDTAMPRPSPARSDLSPTARRRQPRGRAVPEIAVQRRGNGLIAALMDTIAETSEELGWTVSRDIAPFATRPDVVKVVWNGRRFPLRGPTLFCEHGWLPRSSYQISPQGINAGSHAAPFRWDGLPLEPVAAAALAAHLEALHDSEAPRAEMRTAVDAADPGRDVILVPLQMEGDTNLTRHAPPNLTRMQSLIDHVSRADPPLPILFKQHPADTRGPGRHLALRLRRRQDRLFPCSEGNVHALLRSGRCRGIVTINSNVAHDGILWNVPSVVLGRNIWPQDPKSGPFLTRLPKDWDALFGLWQTEERRAARDAYAHYLMRTQWTLDDMRDGDTLRALLESAIASPSPASPAPGALRHTRAAPPRPLTAPAMVRTLPLINVVARNRGWVFEDLKRALAARSGRVARIIASETPLARADAQVFVRTAELAHSAAPERAVVLIHDYVDHDAYRPGGPRETVAQAGAIVVRHSDQLEILANAGLAPSDRKVLCRPLGAPARFVQRQTRRGTFRLGWAGRPETRGEVDIARSDWVAAVAAELPRPVEVVLLGDKLGRIASALRRAGFACRTHRTAELSDLREAQIYRDLDALLLTGAEDPGPPALFKALASGVPVVAPPVGAARDLLACGTAGALGDTPRALAQALEPIQTDPRAWLRRRDAIRGVLAGATLEGWCDAVIDLAIQLLPEIRSIEPAEAPARALA